MTEPSPEVVQAAEPADERVEVTYERHQIRCDYADPKDPTRHHVALVRDTPKDIAKFTRRGFRVATPEEIAEHDGVVDGRIVRHGDRVAMLCSREDQDRREYEAALEHKARDRRLQASASRMAQDGYSGGGIEVEQSRTRGKMVNVPIEFTS